MNATALHQHLNFFRVSPALHRVLGNYRASNELARKIAEMWVRQKGHNEILDLFEEVKGKKIAKHLDT